MVMTEEKPKEVIDPLRCFCEELYLDHSPEQANICASKVSLPKKR